MKSRKITYILCIGILCLQLQGCLVAAVGVGIGAIKWANAKKEEAQLKCKYSYANYSNVMFKHHKKPMTLAEYCNN